MSKQSTHPIVVGFALLGLAMLACPGWADPVPDQEILKAAQEGLPRFLAAIPPEEIESFGFHNQEELGRATLGEPFLIHKMLPNDIFEYAEDGWASDLIRPTHTWLFPVICDGTPRTLLTVAPMSGRWGAVDIGGLSPAPEIQELKTLWPASQGWELSYVLVYQTGSQFMMVSRAGLDYIVPIESTARLLGIVPDGKPFQYELKGIPEIVDALVPFVHSALEGLEQ